VKTGSYRANAEIRRPKMMRPFRYTVCFINASERYRR